MNRGRSKKEDSLEESEDRGFNLIGKSVILRHQDGRLLEGCIVWLGLNWIVVKTTATSKEPNKTLGFHANKIAHFEIIEKSD